MNPLPNDGATQLPDYAVDIKETCIYEPSNPKAAEAVAAEREACRDACLGVLKEYAERGFSAGDLSTTDAERAAVGVCIARITLRSNV